MKTGMQLGQCMAVENLSSLLLKIWLFPLLCSAKQSAGWKCPHWGLWGLEWLRGDRGWSCGECWQRGCKIGLEWDGKCSWAG